MSVTMITFALFMAFVLVLIVTGTFKSKRMKGTDMNNLLAKLKKYDEEKIDA